MRDDTNTILSDVPEHVEPYRDNIGFKTSNDFCIYIEELKESEGFETFMETVAWYATNECDMEMEDVAKHLNKYIRDKIASEARQFRMLKDNDVATPLF